MTWLYIFLYIVGVVFSAWAFDKLEVAEDKGGAILWALIFPLAWPLFLILGLSAVILAGIDGLGELWDKAEKKRRHKKETAKRTLSDASS